MNCEDSVAKILIQSKTIDPAHHHVERVKFKNKNVSIKVTEYCNGLIPEKVILDSDI